ncbi:transcriptional regulator [Spongiactinospora rosea]|uniref:Transcriptional regulator n=1 Tax=Spongiactinospora rosea TaxID=2248750 RepID=A0A366LJF3_9ACTN|nr:helix-turn-helix transcriptional regulator [Spongiactinospora rosea]RBQ14015.1 transcriptional regulator [Spongiactinospora rosea]
MTSSPTARRRRLGHELRRLREAARLKADDVAGRLGWSPTKVSRIETGRVSVHHGDVSDLLDIYEIRDERLRDELTTMARQSRQKGWWHRHRETLKRGFDSYIGLEAEASTLLTFQPQVIPGLLQTQEYARAIIMATSISSGRSDETAEKLNVRASRQELLTRNPPLSIHAILDEAIFHRQFGVEIMMGQCAKLLELSALPNVTIQVLAFSSGAHPALDGAFNILEFPLPIDPAIVYLEQAASGLVLEDAHELTMYTDVFQRLAKQALPPDESASLISTLMEDPKGSPQ